MYLTDCFFPYRPSIRGKKWYFPLITNGINLSIVAAWRIHCALSSAPISHLQFRREVTICLLKTPLENPRTRPLGGGGLIVGLPSILCYDGLDHHKVSTTQGRCKICKKNIRLKCEKCDVRLHRDPGLSCFENYHSFPP